MAMKVIKKTVKANKPAKTVKKQELEDEDEVLDEEEDEAVDEEDEDEDEDEVDEDEDDASEEDDEDEDEEEEPAPKKSSKKAPVKKNAKSAAKAPVKKAVKEAPKKSAKAPAKKKKEVEVVIEGNALTVDDKADNLKNILEDAGLASLNETITKTDADAIFKAVEKIQVAALENGKTFKIGSYSVNRKNVAARVYPAVSAIAGMDDDTLITAHTEMTLKVFPDKDNCTFKGKKVKDGVFKTSEGKTVKY